MQSFMSIEVTKRFKGGNQLACIIKNQDEITAKKKAVVIA